MLDVKRLRENRSGKKSYVVGRAQAHAPLGGECHFGTICRPPLYSYDCSLTAAQQFIDLVSTDPANCSKYVCVCVCTVLETKLCLQKPKSDHLVEISIWQIV